MSETLRRRLRQASFADDVQETVLALMVAATSMRDRVDALCARHGISGQQYNVLRVLRGAYPAGHPRCEIATRLIDRASDVTRLLDRLEEAGLVRRERSTEDRRLSITYVTPAGLELLERIDPDLQREHARVRERLDETERAQLARLCAKLTVEDPAGAS